MSGFITLPLAAVTESTFNPRRHFDPAKLAELAENIKASGVHQPILVRPLPGARVPDTAKGVTHEIVAGARRFRASQLAGMAAIPAVVRDLDDGAALEVALWENIHRADLTALEEAEGYDALIRATGITREALAKKIGRSPSYVHASLKLLASATGHGGKRWLGKVGAIVAQFGPEAWDVEVDFGRKGATVPKKRCFHASELEVLA